MATATVDSSASNHHLNHLHTESLPLIDLGLLSQSELLSLSLCSSYSSSLHYHQNDDDVATPKIDRSVFNESAGSRKQTFSRLRLAPRNNSQFSSSPLIESPIVSQTLDEENSQIISLLKSLFGANSHSDEKEDNNNNDNDNNLVSIPIQYNQFLGFPSTVNEALQNVPIGIANYDSEEVMKQAIPTSIVDYTTKKRKRGRPRKNESNFYSDSSNPNQVSETENKQRERETIGVDGSVDKEKKKGEMLTMNKNGMKMDLVALGSMEDPYGGELMIRTAGMHTEAELLGFLQGLEGEWVTSRKKKMIVDASVLGNVLPSGWKLMLCIKKKAGFFWIACRRYISPNGQQFMSCKEVSSYLLSSFGLQDASQSNFDHVDGNVHLTDKISSGNAADLTLKADKNGDEKQSSSLNIGIPGQVQTLRKYKCHKCIMVFDEPDDLLQHLLSSHHRTPKRLKQGASMNEEVIMKNGKYECQFCHKPFEEMHRYNGHLGNHIKDYFKRIEASSGFMTIQRSPVPPLLGVHPDVLKIQESIGIAMGAVAVNSDIKINDEISSAVPNYKTKENPTGESYCDKQDIVCSTTNDKGEKMNKVTDVDAVGNNVYPGAVSAISNKENDSVYKSSDEKNVIECTTGRISNLGSQETGSQSCSLAAVGRNQGCANDNDEDQAHIRLMEEHYQERGSDSGLIAPHSEKKTVDGKTIEDRLHSSTVSCMTIDDRVFVGKDKLRTDFGVRCSAQENVSTNSKEQSYEGCLVVTYGGLQRYGSVNNVHGLSTSAVELKHEMDSKGGLTSSDFARVSNNKMYQVSGKTVNKPKLKVVGRSRNDVQTVGFGSNSTLIVEDTKIINDMESSYGSCSAIPSWNEQICFTENNMKGNPSCTRKIHHQEKDSEGSELTLYAHQQCFDSENINVNVSNGTLEVPNHVEVPCSNNSEHSKDIDALEGCVTNIELGRSSNNFSLFPLANGLTFALKDDGVLNDTSKNFMQDRNFESSLGGPSSDVKTHFNENNMNKVSCNTMDWSKHKGFKSQCDGEPLIVFDHGHSEQDVDVVKSTMLESCSKDFTLVNSGNQEKFSMEDNLNGVYSCNLDEKKRASIDSLLCLSSSEQVWSAENNSNRILTGKVQEEPRLQDLNPRRNESVIGSSSHTQTSENVVSGFMWRTDEENDLLGSFADTSSRLVNSSSCFPSYDVMSDKGETEFFGEKFCGISGFEGLRSGSMENMEYNFMNPHSDDSRVFSYDAEIARGLDSSVWLDKEALPLLPKIASRRRVPTLYVCVWCRNEFHYEALESEAQASSLGFTCAACKAKFSGQFNLL
ncbi:hypothetical protein P3X46_021308 [Hevea brasiliensis]|uniref:C2H2-type domain-containing protein n=1 Tax=Hevea brasiliensis TaxID=3981 RepID=A0ABQ9LGC2_HEVBR|nr:uncharacterized protein LOC110638595 [Hevea brasiliensis]KAJ9166578.1 hypothetical protein P3X46_021308 [Hevea brasiliensis]